MRLKIVQGKRRGKEFPIGDEPLVIGRDRGCSVILGDDQLVSARHAELGVDSRGTLTIRDLESVNGTDVNGESVGASELHPGDQITIGNTVFEVIEEVTDVPMSAPVRKTERKAPSAQHPVRKPTRPEPEPEPEDVEEPEEAEESEPEQIDDTVGLEFGEPSERKAPQKTSPSKRIASLALTAVITLAVVGIGFYLWREFERANIPRQIVGGSVDTNRTELYYERVQASKDNIFRFAMRIAGGKLVVNIDDLKQNRHFQPPPKDISERVLNEMIAQLKRTGFDNLKAKYVGLAAEQQETAVIELTIGTRVQRVEVENTMPPEGFEKARGVLEDFAKVECKLVTLSRSREELLKDADEAFLRGKRLYESRDVDYPNLYNALKELQAVQNDLETIEPKPEIYRQSVAMEADAREALNQQINSLRFQADKSIKLSDWAKSYDALKQILARIPDRDDERYREAERLIISVQAHLRR